MPKRNGLFESSGTPGANSYQGPPVIVAADDPDGTIYTLLREGEPPVSSAWPRMLEALAPTARRLPTWM